MARFDFGPVRVLDQAGNVETTLPGFARDREALARHYRAMVLTRQFDTKAVALQRTGRLGTFASSLGQEAVSVGVASAMRDQDVFLPSFREHGGQLWRGVTLKELFLFWGGDERGNDFSGHRMDFPACIPVATQFPQAAGVALAMQAQGTGGVAVPVGGDGATSKGDFYEAMNIAGAWALPVVFVISNNQWAISVPLAAQTRAVAISDKAMAAGIPGGRVDGNDVIAVRAMMERALERARSGGGATLIEAVTYRLGDHTTADDSKRYRNEAEVSAHWKAEPLVRLRAHLVQEHGWTKEEEETLQRSCREDVETAAEAYLATGLQPPRAIIDHLFESVPEDLAQRFGEAGYE
ncbi:pyruvate dehydrogenase (acetyl-transferring) E1 component subunit alpha [Aliiruegeria sabulilitoris]|uniref:pyruvate dehydrogenase (acetyl-transferring) E1 component subunit alpha n=1 Tax=Aliiruegeria sabulilitoris TaxID=1510458 RepID=UPI000829BD6A|nr:pyruvate dehydrogenase (acetyl-transferring) E1 component subunit alpha [Aliiruegeria sabulilitoris]NDR58840.1 pyruvate dehydrogenase (acetyl-transferring) E1 component subunit alpha [Pseudoruegeria sp. M32A2M]